MEHRPHRYMLAHWAKHGVLHELRCLCSHPLDSSLRKLVHYAQADHGHDASPQGTVVRDRCWSFSSRALEIERSDTKTTRQRSAEIGLETFNQFLRADFALRCD